MVVLEYRSGNFAAFQALFYIAKRAYALPLVRGVVPGLWEKRRARKHDCIAKFPPGQLLRVAFAGFALPERRKLLHCAPAPQAASRETRTAHVAWVWLEVRLRRTDTAVALVEVLEVPPRDASA